ncbi:hypothetical protein LX36DRAFT_559383, partial [Colletotrichum falcatum]
HYIIPFAKNRRFVERTKSSDIQRMMFDEVHQTLALVGLGGAGKTQIALNIAYWVKENKPEYSIFWIPALSFASFQQAYADIAKELDLRPSSDGEDIKTTVRQFLVSKKAGRWLLIVDNADDKEILHGSPGEQNGLINYLPRNGNGFTLFTTRSRELALSVADDAPIELDVMEKAEAEVLFTRSIHRQHLLQDHDSVVELLDFLAQLPLAITQASAYLNRNTGVTIKKYLHLLRGPEQTRMNTLSRELPDSTRYPNSRNAIASTWLLSFNQIQKTDSYAAELLYFISRIEPKSIPRSMLPSSRSEEELEYAIGTLGSYAFLVEQDGGQTFDMHSLVHLATRIWVRNQSMEERMIGHAVKHLNEIFPTENYRNRTTWRQYMPHTIKVLSENTEAETDEKVELYSQVGRCLLEDARTKEAIK